MVRGEGPTVTGAAWGDDGSRVGNLLAAAACGCPARSGLSVSLVTSSSGDGSSAYGEGERLFGPPQGSYDAAWVAATARSKDPGLPEETARELAVYAWEHLRAVQQLDAPEVARRLMADHPEAGATPAAVVARAAVEFCEAYGVTLA